MLLQEGVDLDTRAETQQSPHLCVRQRARTMSLQRQALEGQAGQIGPLPVEILGDVLGEGSGQSASANSLRVIVEEREDGRQDIALALPVTKQTLGGAESTKCLILLRL